MAAESECFHEGDCVRVKQGVMCPDFEGLSLAGWKGRLFCVELWDDEPMVGAKWDSVTVAAMPKDFLAGGVAQGLDCRAMYLGMEEVERAQPRDSEADTERNARTLDFNSLWLDMGAQGRRILDVMEGLDPDDPWEVITAWSEYLGKTLTFPFDAKVCESQECGPLADGDTVCVLAVDDVDELMGVIVRVKHGWRKRAVPLCELEAFPRESPAFLPLRDYAVWFANR